jgi:hypothetical protein
MAKETQSFQERVAARLGASEIIELKQTLVQFDTEGQIVYGKFNGVKSVKTRFGDGNIAELIDPDTGEVQSVFLSITLEQWFEENAPTIGEVIAVQYLGKNGRINNFKAIRLEG